MNLKLNKAAVLLCAVIMFISCLVPVPPATAAGELPDPETFVYAVDIEFGSLSFYYDYGIWNVNTMRYEAAATSEYPAFGTIKEFPGWYGFDGTANRIAVYNTSLNGKSVYITLGYRAFTQADYTNTLDYTVSGVEMAITDSAGELLWAEASDDKPHTFEVPLSKFDSSGKLIPVERYIHLSGTPKKGVDGSAPNYVSNTIAPIGMFSLTITDWDEATS